MMITKIYKENWKDPKFKWRNYNMKIRELLNFNNNKLNS